MFAFLSSLLLQPSPLVVDGGSGQFPPATCLTDPNATSLDGVVIATQCCGPATNGSAGCEASNCMGGVTPTRYTFAQATAQCDTAGLVLCGQACSSTCGYEAFPLWSNGTCATTLELSCSETISAGAAAPAADTAKEANECLAAIQSVSPVADHISIHITVEIAVSDVESFLRITAELAKVCACASARPCFPTELATEVCLRERVCVCH